MAQSNLEQATAFLIKLLRFEEPEREFRFDDKRKWRFDFAWPKRKVALEVEGGVWSGGRHVRPAGFAKDVEKYNAATTQGWRVIRVTAKMLQKVDTLGKLLEDAGVKRLPEEGERW